jgi:bifunctional non-homologous end joining protein LigD
VGRCRAQLRYDGRTVSLRMRQGRECSADFPELAEIACVLRNRRVTLDGELVCLRPDGRPDFARLRRRLTAQPQTGIR